MVNQDLSDCMLSKYHFVSCIAIIQKLLGQILKGVCIKSFKQHAFDPLLFNKTIGYFHETLIRYCSCFKVLQLHHSFPKYSRKVF